MPKPPVPVPITRKGAHRCSAETAKRTLPARYWAKVDKRGPDECWPWLGGKSCGGHGVIWTGGQPYQKPAHHIALLFAGVEVPVGMLVDHTCRNRGCVNPAHLRVVTATVNALENNDNPFAKNKRKTHCKHGHPLSGSNVRLVKGVTKKGHITSGRVCLACYGPGGVRKKLYRKPASQRTEGMQK